MEILGNHDQNTTFAKFKHKLHSRKVIVLALTVMTFLIFGATCLIYGAYLQKTGQTTVLKLFLIRASELDFSFIPMFAQGTTVEIDQLALDIKFKYYEKLRYFREMALSKKLITEEMQEEVPAKIRYNNHTYRVGLSLTGLTTDHLKHPYKWSLNVKVKDGKTIMGMKKFALLYPSARGYLTDWIATKILTSLNVIGLRIDFVDVEVNGKNQGIYYLEERYDKRMIENNRSREGIVFRVNKTNLKFYGVKSIKESAELGIQLTRLKRSWHGFLTNDIQVNDLFDLPKFAALFAVSDLMSQKHPLSPSNMRLYYNPITGLIEPIGREWGYLRKEWDSKTSLSIEEPDSEVLHHVKLIEIPLIKKIMEPFEFQEEYIKKMELISRPEYLDSIFESNKHELELISNKVYKQNPFYKFPADLLRHNQEYLRKKLFPDFPSIKVYFDQKSHETISLYVENKINLPIEIHSIEYNTTHFYTPRKRLLLESKFKKAGLFQEVKFIFPDSINSTTFSSDSLEVYYSILGINDIQSTIVYPKVMSTTDYSKLIPTQQKSNFQEFGSIEYDNHNKIIKFLRPVVEIDKDIIIPDGYTLSAEPGTKINLTNASRIISYSPISFIGEPNNEIILTSSDSTGQGIVVFSATTVSELSHVKFEHLSNITDGSWVLSGVITFFESSLYFQ